ncbi:LysM peptidoglycan-binding domain-containing protein [Sporosarcina thermotolerans]|uniref:LysM peptidoglycan-binding domain-containing protein n=1 Tax=Sporosarcina thermotolerans TaxID=633404 RepID=A0AAW9AAL0_9BACL|nr:LysM peptidoglycan-binding domain-containing protein [Sporosarcina thermotolerans]MDW0118089.1 LysM peptidoglycan-binding domain-containing protein [Sporosarcina thermotolerans]WHT47582.1 LysM peptidoglycan-binding domain-containing protein [Sporosarcina thermotolerans]
MDVHIVVKGDTLWKIARQYGIPFEDLKRVNAHLANPDYIVPGMKIFLPKKAEHKPGGKGPEKMPEKHHHQPAAPPMERHHHQPAAPPMEKHHHQPAAPPMEKHHHQPAAPPKEKHHHQPAIPPMEKHHHQPVAPKQPIPLPHEKEKVKPMPPAAPPQMKPPVPQPPVMQPPKLPETPPAPPVMPPPAPPVMPLPAPPVMPLPMPPMAFQPCFQPCCQPIMPFHCGWVPIYDADCMPIMHPGFAQPTPLPAMQMPPQQLGTPSFPAQSGVMPPLMDISEEEEYEESPIHPGGGMGVSPNYPISGWELTESPTMESPTMEMPMENEMMNLPPEQQPYIPQMISPGFQPNQGGMLPRPQDVFGANFPWHMYCSCGCHQFPGHFPGFDSGFYPTNMMPMQSMPAMQPMMQPMQPMQPMQMFPTQMYPMNMQQFNLMDNNGCGC